MQAMFVAVFQGQLHLISMQKIPMRLAQHAEVSYFIFGLKTSHTYTNWYNYSWNN